MTQPPFTVQRIDHIVLRVRALEPALGFYRDVLGCQVERDQPALGLTQLRAGASLIDLVTLDGPLGRGAPPQREGCNLEHFCLTLAPFDAAHLTAWLREHGVAVEPPEVRYGAQGEGASFYIEDPDGNKVELKGARQDE